MMADCMQRIRGLADVLGAFFTWLGRSGHFSTLRSSSSNLWICSPASPLSTCFLASKELSRLHCWLENQYAIPSEFNYDIKAASQTKLSQAV